MAMPRMAVETPLPSIPRTCSILEAILFVTMWEAMLVAMMFLSVYPMVLPFARVSQGQTTQAKRSQMRTGSSSLGIWCFGRRSGG